MKRVSEVRNAAVKEAADRQQTDPEFVWRRGGIDRLADWFTVITIDNALRAIHLGRWRRPEHDEVHRELVAARAAVKRLLEALWRVGL